MCIAWTMSHALSEETTACILYFLAVYDITPANQLRNKLGHWKSKLYV